MTILAVLLPGGAVAAVIAAAAVARTVQSYRILDAVDIRTVNTAYEDGAPPAPGNDGQ